MPTKKKKKKSNITDFICRHIQYLYYSTTNFVMFQNNHDKNNQYELIEGLYSCCFDESLDGITNS